MFINVKKLNSKAKLPERATATSAGADLCACIDDDVVLMPGDRKLIPTGLAAFRLQTASALSIATTEER